MIYSSLFYLFFVFFCVQGMNTRRKQARLFRHSVELKITREIFIEWLSGAQQLQLAKRTHEMHILKE